MMTSSTRFVVPLVWMMVFGAAAMGVTASDLTTESAMLGPAADMDFLSDGHWRQLPREERQRRFNQAFLARLEPTGQPSAERLPLYIERYKHAVIYDQRLAVFRVDAVLRDAATRKVRLTGEVSLPQYRRGLQDALAALGFEVVENSIEVLPSASLGPMRYAVATTFSATMRREPRLNAEQVNSIALGWPLRLLRVARANDLTTAPQRDASRPRPHQRRTVWAESPSTAGEWYLAQSAEGYVGFVRSDDITRVAGYSLPEAMLLIPTTATLPASGEHIELPTGCGLKRSAAGRWQAPVASGVIEIDLPADRIACNRSEITAQSIESLAQPLLGTPYVWGGVTHEGIDCSGFSQFLYRALGVQLPRDAEEQAAMGLIVAFGEEVDSKARPGDLIFFVNERGRISHVAVSLGGHRLIHSSQHDVHVGTLDDRRDNGEVRLRDRVLYARRVLGW